VIRILLRLGILIGATVIGFAALNDNTLFTVIGFVIVAAGLILDLIWGMVKSVIKIAVLLGIGVLIFTAITRGFISLPL